MVHDAGDAEGADEAQQVGQETECDAEDERPSEGLPQSLPDQLWTKRRRGLRPLKGREKQQNGVQPAANHETGSNNNTHTLLLIY